MVEEFIHQTSLPVYMPEDMQCILNANDLAANLIELKDNKPKATFVLIVPPDKSLAIVIDDDMILIYDSHQHLPYGALISYCDTNVLDTFCQYIERMVATYYNSCLLQSNLIHIEVIQ